jgi:hypothetical protein
MTNNGTSFYTSIQSHLQQADIFRLDIIAPVADTAKRIFRTQDGQHGSVYFEGQTQAKVFSEEDLSGLLSSIPTKTPWHVSPFSKTSDGQEEMVVAAAKRFRYFILASQTCDISGKDKQPLPWGTILPIITLGCMCKEEVLPFPQKHIDCSIHKYITDNCSEASILHGTDDSNYGSVIRANLPQWMKSSGSGIKKDLQRIATFINNKFDKKNCIYPLAEDTTFGIPEGYIDFTMISIVPTSKLEEIKSLRIAHLSDTYGVEFIQKFGLFFSRAATPMSIAPPSIKEGK